MNSPRFGFFARAIVPLLFLFAVSGHAHATESVPADFCAWAQGVIAETSLVPVVEVPADRQEFVESKALDDPFTVQQFADVPAPAAPELLTVVSCKMRTAERINSAHPQEDGSDSPVAGRESSCDEVHRQMLDQALQQVPADRRQAAADRWVVDEEELTFMGPQWLEPWPFVPVTEDQQGLWHLRTRVLYVPYAWWLPMPERFLGNYYCHLVSPAYLDALVNSELSPPGP
jgi:hypothetical protein